MIEKEREYVRIVLAQALGDGLRVRGETQASWQLFHLIQQLEPSEWNAVLGYVVGRLEDEGIILAVEVADNDHM